MQTVAETPLFIKQAAELFTEEEISWRPTPKRVTKFPVRVAFANCVSPPRGRANAVEPA
jgi:hypothetical protein